MSFLLKMPKSSNDSVVNLNTEQIILLTDNQKKKSHMFRNVFVEGSSTS